MGHTTYTLTRRRRRMPPLAKGIDMKKPTIYTFGYEKRQPEELVAEAERLSAVVVDVRLKPYSRRREWNLNNLARLCGPVHGYLWIKGFGNLNYKGGPIELADPEDGLARVAHDIERGRNIILLCYEADPKTCHRWQVAELIAKRFGCRIEHLVLKGSQLSLL
jgi:uncharacterized protein (DUF488 family)